MDLGAALIAMFIALVVKLGVMALSATLIVRLYRPLHPHPPRRPWLLLPPDAMAEVRILWWALVLFGISEATCGVEVYVILHSSPVTSAIHAATSGAGMGLFALGLWMFLDARLVHYTQPACAVKEVCRGCPVRAGLPCRYRALLLLGATFLALCCVVPFFAPTDALDANTRAYTLPFPVLNAWWDDSMVPWLRTFDPDYDPSGRAFCAPHVELWMTFRLQPAVALCVAGGAIVLLLRGREALATRWMALSAGIVCYSIFEIVLYFGIGEVLAASLAHEVAEFWFLVVTAEFLARTFPAAGAAT